jgi:hypothetical protein
LGRLKDGKRRPTVLVKELRERDRRRMLRHFLDLEDSDRLLRFGSVLPDEQITHYVNRIAFSRDMVFGVYNRVFRLVAVGHLAFAPRDESKSAVTVKERVANLASPSADRRAAWASAPNCSSAPPSTAATTTSTRCTCTACRPTRP